MATVLDFTVIARDRASKTFDKVSKSTDKSGKAIDKWKVAAVAAGAAVGAVLVKVGADAVRNASAAEQSLGATQTVFGNFSASVVKTSERAAKSFGLSTNEYRENANVIGSILKNQGVSNDQLAGKTQALIQKGADLSAVFGGSAKDAVDALSSAFKGEFDPIERYGISLKQSTINAEAMNQAHVKTQAEFNKLTPAAQAAAKQQATLSLINKQSAATQGQFAAQTGTTAERLQIAKAQYTNLTAQIGTKLLPVMNILLGVGSGLITFFSTYGRIIVPVVGALGLLTAGIYALIVAQRISAFLTKQQTEQTILYTVWQKVAAGASKAMAAGQWLLNAALTANPIGLVIVGIALLVGGLILAYKKSETFRNIVNGAFHAVAATVGAVVAFIRSHWRLLFAILTGPVGLAVLWIATHWGTVKNIFSGAKRAIGKALSGITSVITAPFRAAFAIIMAGIHAIENAMNALKGGSASAQAKVTKTHAYSVGRGGGISGARAGGGPVSRGQAYLVGENGPELFVPGQSGGIVPNGQTGKAMSGGGGGDVYNIHLSGMVGDKQGLARTVIAALQDLQRSTGKPLQIKTT